MDPIDNMAIRDAQEIRNPSMAPQALQEIHNELHQMMPGQALHFARAIDRDLGLSSSDPRAPLQEHPEMGRPGNEVLTMADPYGHQQIVKEIRQEFLNQGYPQQGFVPGQIQTPGYPQPGYPQPGYPQPGYGQPVYPYNPAANVGGAIVGGLIGGAIVGGLLDGGHRRRW